MNLGLSIFLSALIIGLVLLFNSTKDRWNWKKISKWMIIVVVLGLSGFGIYKFILPSLSFQYPTLASTFWDISLGSSKEDVTFIKGDNHFNDEINSSWIYDKTEYSWRVKVYEVYFKNDKVSAIIYSCSDWDYDSPKLLNRQFYNYDLKSVKDFFGEPSDITKSKDGTVRGYSFKKYQIVFYLRENKVFGYGIYNPEYGPLNY